MVTSNNVHIVVKFDNTSDKEDGDGAGETTPTRARLDPGEDERRLA
jgi:hypothetical protein